MTAHLTSPDRVSHAQKAAAGVGVDALLVTPGPDLRWLTGYDQAGLDAELAARTDFENFFAAAPRLNPARALITGSVCGVRVEAVEEPLMREIRYLDKLVDELARGRPMAKILRG